MKRLKKIAEGNYFNAQEMAEKNRKIVDETGSTEGCRSFEWNGYSIIDPFMDETGTNAVDPISYYEDAFKNSEFAK
jgi:hypothetical protein